MTKEDFDRIRSDIPGGPGVYQFKSESGEILYVGKAKNLRKRVSSYFLNKYNQAYKIKSLVRTSVKIDCLLVNSESDALLLENNLIKKFQPRYNVNLKDGKSYTYLCIKKERFPRVFFTRKLIRDGSTYFGPYTSKYKAKLILDLIKNLFPLRTCSLNLAEKNIQAGKFKVCLEYHIKRCIGPCEGYESEATYQNRVQQITNILRGNFAAVKQYLKEEMQQCVESLEFEKANELKEKLSLFEDYQSKSTIVNPSIQNVDVFTIVDDGKEEAYVNYIRVINGAVIYANTFEIKKKLLDETKKDMLAFAIHELRQKFESDAPEIYLPFRVRLFDQSIKQIVPKIGDKRKLIDLSLKNAYFFIKQKRRDEATRQKKVTHAERILTTLKNDLQLEDVPLQIECFDNSNLQGSYPVSSCVVFKNAKPSKKDYRHFHIKTVVGPDDFASMEEVVYRRYKRLVEEKVTLPQLVIIDGGKGQLNAAMNSIKRLNLEDRIIVIGIAKRLEEIFFPDDPIPLYINKKSESLKLIQQLRNEAHRFAITFHRNQRSKHFTTTELMDIDGIGETIATKLLVQFKSIKGIRKATPDELKALIGNSKAEKILAYFNNEEE